MKQTHCPQCGSPIPPPLHGRAAACGRCGASLAAPLNVAIPVAMPLTAADRAPFSEPITVDHLEYVDEAEFAPEAEFKGEAEFVQPLPDEPSAPMEANTVEANAAAANAETVEYAPRRSHRFEIFFFLTVLAGMLLVGAAAVGYLLWQHHAFGVAGNSPREQSANPYVSTSNEQIEETTQWLNAGEGALRIDNARVEILRAEYGEVRGRDASGALFVSGKRYLQIEVRVENTGFAPLKYRSWYGNEFPTDSGALRVRLRDEQQRSIPWKIFEGIQSIRWNTPQAVIEPGKEISDVIIFELPADVDREKLEYVRLDLPAAAAGHEGFYHFELPRDMIEDL